MRKIFAAGVVGLALVAGQAAASAQSAAAVRAGDRIGATVTEGEELLGLPLFILIPAAIAAVVIIDEVVNDDSDSD